MAKEDNIKFDCNKGWFYGATKEDIKRWKKQYDYIDFDNIDELMKEASLSVQIQCLTKTPGGGFISRALAGPDPELKSRVYGKVSKNPGKFFEDFLIDKHLSLSSALSENQKERLGTGSKKPAGTGQRNEQGQREFLLETAEKVSTWIIDEVIMKRFKEQAKAFYDEITDWECKEDKEQTEYPVDRLVLPYATHLDARIGKITDDYYLKHKSIPFDEEKSLQANYVLLTIIHDKRLENPRTPLISESIWPKNEEWVELKYRELVKGCNCGGKDIQTHIKLALQRVEKDLPKPPAETGHENAIGFMSAADLAKHHRVDSEALRKRLDRYRANHALDANLYIESQDRGRNKAKYLYDAQKVLSIIKDLKSKKRPSNVHQRK